ncbi:formate--tetrahydrofolate ligase [Roseiterribacter gracilis]|uniref:Formate--tetrahydrofolate ligase n=1 Tax=Roseiterribacter gracilis TaxID=2812848 RepID=A0A8S8XG47_9PROT|nr:formate--tetrahydrofolate ligase [Rhodospirillales bacterium TMPK1]
MTTDIEVARTVTLKKIGEIADKAGIPAESVFTHGRHLAKLDLDYVEQLRGKPDGHLILVTAINPTPPGEGKTTTTIGLGDALNRIGKRAVVALREPSLGPVFGRKGGATGGGRAQVAPMEAINLHFTGDFHAITAAHNLLAAMLDNHIYWGNALDIDLRAITWRRVADVNDRALRKITIGLGEGENGLPRETGFDITVASEVMAILCLADDLVDLQARLARIVVARKRDGTPVTAGDLQAAGAMAALLRDAIQPNLVQTLEHNPVLVHGGPFANIAHGCNSVIATRTAMKLGDFAVTEAGFGADLGAEKFFDIKCRSAGLTPSAVVIVATLRALKYQGGAPLKNVTEPNAEILARGLASLGRHIENMQRYGVPVVVGINHFAGDTDAEHAQLAKFCADKFGVKAIVCRHWAKGSAGAEELAHEVVALTQKTSNFAPLYALDLPLKDKIETIARSIYHAGGIALSARAEKDLARFEREGWNNLPVCIAKTPYSFSADETLLGAPEGHILPVREVRLSAGAGFVVAICGNVMTMPGLPRAPSANLIHLDAHGRIEGLF